MIRHAARQFAVQTLYQIEIGKMTREVAVQNIKLRVEDLREEAIQLIKSEMTREQLFELDEQFQLDEFYYSLVDGVLDHQEAIDQIIKANLEGWSLNRLNKVDKAIIRLATYEMVFDCKAPNEIIINEALELTKEFSEIEGGKARSFNNKLLDKISKHEA